MFIALLLLYQLIGKRILYNTFDMTDIIDHKIDKLTVMMNKLVMEDKGQNRPFKP